MKTRCQVGMKNVVKYWKDFLLYFTTLETYHVPWKCTLKFSLRCFFFWSQSAFNDFVKRGADVSLFFFQIKTTRPEEKKKTTLTNQSYPKPIISLIVYTPNTYIRQKEETKNGSNLRVKSTVQLFFRVTGTVRYWF